MTYVGELDPYFKNLYNSVMVVEQQPLYRLKERKGDINTQRGVYLDLKTELDKLQSLATSLISTDAFTSIEINRAVSVVNTDSASDATVLTASARSGTGLGDFDISVTNLAKAQRKVSAVQTSADQELGLSGTFWLGGTGTASASVTPDGTVTAAGIASVGDNLLELGTLEYTVETRDNSGTLEFRLKDIDGNVLAIDDLDDASDSTTSSWQLITDGTDNGDGTYTLDTNRGLTITIDSLGSATDTSVNYTAAGVGVTVNSTDSLVDIASNINAVDQPVGRDLNATVVGTQLVLTAANTGTGHSMIFTDSTDGGLGFGADQRAAENSSFSVNGINFTTSSNIGLSEIIYGITLNLLDDAESENATLSVEADMSETRGAISQFVDQFNFVLTYLDEKTSITEKTDDGQTTYKRGLLTNDSTFSGLRMDLLSLFMSDVENSGSFDNLRDIGLSLDGNLQASISDSDVLEDALENNLDNVIALFDQLMSDLDTELERLTETNDGYLDVVVSSIDSQIMDINWDIKNFEIRLDDKADLLIRQFTEMQVILAGLSYMQQAFSTMYGGFNARI